MSIPTAIRESVYQLKAQGLSTHEIAADLKTRFPDVETPTQPTIWRMLTDPEATALVTQAASRIRATVSQRTDELIGGVYDALRESVETKDARSADAWSRAVVALTRGFVAEKVELTPPKTVDTADELAAILARNGVLLSSEHKNALSDARAKTPDVSTPSVVDTSQHTPDNTR